MYDPFLGKWKLNPENSQFDANHRPKAGTMTFEINPEGHYVMKAEGIKENGETVAERPAILIPDGQPHPLPDFHGLTAITSRPDPHTLTAECRREDGSVVGGGSYVISNDGQSLTATNFGFDSQLRQFEQRTVWDRQSE